MDRRTFLSSLAGGAAVGAVPAWIGAWAQEAPPTPAFKEVTEEQKEAIRAGLEWLARAQTSRGALGQQAQVAFTAIGGLAFMASGSTPSRGPYAANVRNALRFILGCCRRDGYINESGGRGQGGSGMHGHGYALLFLAEIYGMCAELGDDHDTEERLKEAIERAVRVTEHSQDPNGGWSYDPSPYGHEGSVTITQVQALRAVRNAGLKVSKQVIEKGISYIKKSTAADGTIMYSLGSGSNGSYALTAAGACVYAHFGIFDAPEAKRCTKALHEFMAGTRNRQGGHNYYAMFYAGQACFYMKEVDPKLWPVGFEAIRKELLASRDKRTGAWINDGGYNGAFGTACATLILQIPYRYLPILQD